MCADVAELANGQSLTVLVTGIASSETYGSFLLIDFVERCCIVEKTFKDFN